MGIVKKQAYKNTIVSYTGMVIAYINTILLFPFFTTNEQYGLYNLLINVTVLYSLVASLGVPSIIAKYFPFYRNDDRTHNGFMHWAAAFALVGFLVSSILFIFLKPVILSAYLSTSPLFVKYYYYVVPFALFTVFFNFLEVSGRVVYRSIYSSFLRDVFVRLLTTALLLMMAKGWIGFDGFIVLYILSWGVISLLLLINLIASQQFSYRINNLKFKAIKQGEMINYGFYTLIGVSIYVLLQKVDVLMLSAIAGDAVQGVYSWYFNIAMVISVPAAALSRTTYQLVADAWKSKNMENIADVYNKTSIIQMVIGCLLFVGIIINKENLLAIVHDPQKTEQFDVFLVIGLGFLVDITGGLNTYIITTSHKYRLVTAFIVVSSLFCVGLNYVLIPIYGGMGAAIAYLITMAGLNFVTWLYIKHRFNMQPFTYKHTLVIVVALISYFVGQWLWRMPNVYLDIAVRSCTTAICYGIMAYYLKISPDINEKVDQYIKFLK